MTEPVVLCGRYRLVQLIARGGMAEVWEAEDLVLQREVAVKVLHSHLAADPSFRMRFRSEAVAAARLRHPGIVTVYDTCTDGSREAIVMELARNRTLRDELAENGPLSASGAAHIGAAVADALSAAHAAGVVHRDIKPGNILLCDDGRVLVTDFGIAKVRDEADLTATGVMVGTVKYLSPEQVQGSPVDARSDVYSLGTVLFEAVSGRAPFEAETPAATALARLQREPRHLGDLRPDIPPGLVAAISTAMARDPEQRFGSAAELRATLLDPRTLAPAPPADPTLVANPTLVAADDHSLTTFIAPVPAPARSQALEQEPEWPEPPEHRYQRSPVGPVVLASVVLASLLLVVLLVAAI